jgi:O-antigen ligase
VKSRPPAHHVASTGTAESRPQFIVLLAATFLIPLWYSPGGADAFRLPKTLLFCLTGIVLTALLVPRSRELVTRLGRPSWLVTVGFFWTAISVFVAADRVKALRSLLVIASVIAVYVSVQVLNQEQRQRLLNAVIVVAILQSCFAFLQAFDFWVPFVWTFERAPLPDPLAMQVAPLALLGNRNDLGIFLVLPFLAALALLCKPLRERRHWLILAALVVLTLGIVASRTVTAMVAVAIGALVLAMRSRRSAVIGTVLVLAVGAGAFVLSPALRDRATFFRTQIAQRNFDFVLTQRLAAYVASAEMIAQHPLLGVGAGQFAREYFPHRIAGAKHWPALLHEGGSEQNFSEAHNEWLQVTAEYGIAGVLLFGALLVHFGRMALRSGSPFLRLFGVPAAVALAVLSLAQFPLRISASLFVIAVCAGFVASWRDDAQAD